MQQRRPHQQRKGSNGDAGGVKRFRDSTGRIKEIRLVQPHGTVARYNAGCRCEDCCYAESCYGKELRVRHNIGLANPIVPATKARNHILRLQREGLGQVRLSWASGVRLTTIQEIRTKQKTRIRKDTQDAILGVSLEASRYVTERENKQCWRMLDHMVELGFPKTWIAERTRWKPSGQLKHGRAPKTMQYQRGRRFDRRTATKIQNLYSLLKQRGWLNSESARRVRYHRSYWGQRARGVA
jgi:hypothetical protein